jgi:hypothetical protein
MHRGNRTASLTHTEYVLLETLTPPRHGPREVLIDQSCRKESDVSDANLYFFVRSLRLQITQPGKARLPYAGCWCSRRWRSLNGADAGRDSHLLQDAPHPLEQRIDVRR